VNKRQQENVFLNILCNIIVPVTILNKGSSWWGNESGVFTLLLALSFPVAYGLFELLQHQRKSLLSLMGILNVLLTGGLAILKTDGIWFALKEAAFPLLVGIFIGASAFTKKTFCLTRYKPANCFPLKLVPVRKIAPTVPSLHATKPL